MTTSAWRADRSSLMNSCARSNGTQAIPTPVTLPSTEELQGIELATEAAVAVEEARQCVFHRHDDE
jgi:hypothetical protein